MSANPTDEFNTAVKAELDSLVSDWDAKLKAEALASIQASAAKLLEALKKGQAKAHIFTSTDHDSIHEVVPIEPIDQLIKDLTGEGK